MKNEYAEKLCRDRKAKHQIDRKNNFKNAILARHLYDDRYLPKLTWWDDVTFILNNYRVAVAWWHPRQEYKDKIENQACENTSHLFVMHDHLFNTTQDATKADNLSEKFAASTTGSLVNQDWFAAVNAELETLTKKSNYLIRPSIKMTWFDWCRYVDICAPIEVRNEDDLVLLARLVKKILKNETTLDQEFPNYFYTKDNWHQDELTEPNIMKLIHSHRVT